MLNDHGWVIFWAIIAAATVGAAYQTRHARYVLREYKLELTRIHIVVLYACAALPWIAIVATVGAVLSGMLVFR